MMNKVKLVMLIDDNDADNFLHTRAIMKTNRVEHVLVMEDALAALEYLGHGDDAHPHPELIFLDINMPQLTGWEFLDAFNESFSQDQDGVVIVMLSASVNPDDTTKAETRALGGFCSKPLTTKMVSDYLDTFFPDSRA